MIVMAPSTVPEVPMPATARPAISILDEVATPHTRLPSSKTAKNPRNTHWYVVSEFLNYQGLLHVVITLDLKYV
jgi:hypothetical protein